MNRKLLALAVTAALAAPLAAQAAPTVYGQLNLSVDMVDEESTLTDNWQVNSNSSRLGVKGEEALGNGYSAVYKAEFGVAGDVAGGLAGRDRYLGLKAGWGTVKLGAFDSPLKASQGNVDQFNDMVYADMGSYVWGENRQDNVIGYESPKIADAITVKVSLQSGETNADDGFAEAISASVTYETKNLYLAAAMDKDVNNSFNAFSSAVGDGRDAIRLTGMFTMDALQFGAMFQTSETSNEGVGGIAKDDETVMLVSAAYNMGKHTIKGQAALVNDDFGGGAETDMTFLAVGYDHNCTQTTKVFAQVSALNIDNAAPAVDTDDTVVSVGMQTKF
jgi:predicted porin